MDSSTLSIMFDAQQEEQQPLLPEEVEATLGFLVCYSYNCTSSNMRHSISHHSYDQKGNVDSRSSSTYIDDSLLRILWYVLDRELF